MFDRLLKSTGEREISTTMAFVQALNIILRDKQVGPRCVPIVADEARTFGMEGLFRQIGIYAPHGQKYKPVDRDQLMYYREDEAGQVLEEGITEAGAFASWMAAATSYSSQRPADAAVLHLLLDVRLPAHRRQRLAGGGHALARLPARRHRRPHHLNGEGLQHEDGHSHLLAGAIPNCRSYDPTFGFEVAVILQHGMQRMLTEQQDEYYYITLMNENYSHPDMPEGAAEGIIKGMYLLQDAGKPKKGELRVQLLGSGTILREAIAAAELLDKDFGVTADIWSCPSFNELRARRLRRRPPQPPATRKPSRRASRTSPRCWKAVRARRSSRPITCARTPTRSARSCRCTTRCWVRMASVAATRVRTCVDTSRLTGTTSRTPRSRRWRRKGR